MHKPSIDQTGDTLKVATAAAPSEPLLGQSMASGGVGQSTLVAIHDSINDRDLSTSLFDKSKKLQASQQKEDQGEEQKPTSPTSLEQIPEDEPPAAVEK